MLRPPLLVDDDDDDVDAALLTMRSSTSMEVISERDPLSMDASDSTWLWMDRSLVRDCREREWMLTDYKRQIDG